MWDEFTDTERLGRSKKYMYVLRYRLRKTARGLCQKGGCHEKRVGAMCQKHTTEQNNFIKSKRKKQ